MILKSTIVLLAFLYSKNVLFQRTAAVFLTTLDHIILKKCRVLFKIFHTCNNLPRIEVFWLAIKMV